MATLLDFIGVSATGEITAKEQSPEAAIEWVEDQFSILAVRSVNCGAEFDMSERGIGTMAGINLSCRPPRPS